MLELPRNGALDGALPNKQGDDQLDQELEERLRQSQKELKTANTWENPPRETRMEKTSRKEPLMGNPQGKNLKRKNSKGNSSRETSQGKLHKENP